MRVILFPLISALFIFGGCHNRDRQVFCELENHGLVSSIVFRWQPSSLKDNPHSYQIKIASEKVLAQKKKGDLWDSGVLFSPDSSLVYYPPMESYGRTFWWTAQFWDESGNLIADLLPQSFKLEDKTGNRLVLLGGGLISGMEVYSELEWILHRTLYGTGFTVRNLGWPADDVFGQARSQFGSAQNTQSWEPPSAEDGFGSKVLFDQILETRPNNLLIGYGQETAFYDDSLDFEIFKKGYHQLLAFADSLGSSVILVSPPRQEAVYVTDEEVQDRNARLEKTRDFIRIQAEKGGIPFVDLFENLITESGENRYTLDGVQLNQKGYHKFDSLILKSLNLPLPQSYQITLDSFGKVVSSDHSKVISWTKTVRGVEFDVQSNHFEEGQLTVNGPAAIYMDEQLFNKSGSPFTYGIPADTGSEAALKEMIQYKNRMFRYRIRPLNEAYIFLFRRHEMGHLAYEMDEFDQLAAESDLKIQELSRPRKQHFTVELIRPWSPPKNYPEDEVPRFIPEPNIEEELQSFTLAPGLQVNLFAADPMIANPINLNWDAKGRAWVATSSTYPHIVPGREPSDRIVILEDKDGNGQADLAISFAEGLLIPQSVMPVPGGAYVTASTEFMFLADTDGDDRADEKRVLFDGFGNADVHHMIHGLRWMPWGDLHFTQSIYINSFIETAHGNLRLNGTGTWAFRPENGQLSIFSRGLINPWGEGMDAWGQSFATDGAGSSGINYIFPESAHATAVGADRILNGLNSGTPKNTGAEVVYSRHFPAEWQGSIITSDFRANRTVRYGISPHLSGYTAKELETIVSSTHRSYRPVDMKIGPDGALYIVDWYNPVIDHGEVDFHHPVRDRSHGRIWRITHGGRPLVPRPNIQSAGIPQLLDLLKSPELYTRTQANRELVSRHVSPREISEWVKKLPSHPTSDQHRMEALWLHAAIQSKDESLLDVLLNSKDYRVRAAAVRMLGYWELQSKKTAELDRLIRDSHPQVRLETLHALRTWGTLEAMETALKVLDEPLDANLDFAIWLTARHLKDQWLPALSKGQFLGDDNIDKMMFCLISSSDTLAMPLVFQMKDQTSLSDTLQKQAWTMLARLGNGEILSHVLEKGFKEKNATLLKAMVSAPKVNRHIPDDLDRLFEMLRSEEAEMQVIGCQLAGRWKLSAAEKDLTRLAGMDPPHKQVNLAAARALVQLDKVTALKQLARKNPNPAIKTAVISAIAEKDPEVVIEQAMELLTTLDSVHLAEGLFLTYRRHESGPSILTKALAGKKLPEKIANAGLKVVQTSGLDLRELEQAIREAGDLKTIGIEWTPEIKQSLLEEASKTGNAQRGSSIYRRPQLLCATCHQIKGIGGLLGPDLTSVGAYMTPNSILESIVNPSSDIKQGYETVLITRKDGEIVSGTLHRKTSEAVLVRIANGELIRIPNDDIEKSDTGPVSLMPAGLTASLTRDEMKDLIFYLTQLGKERRI